MRMVSRLALLFAFVVSLAAHAQQPRLAVFISDVHLGLGKITAEKWHPYEDFRWSNALKGFLDAISTEGGDRVDLVIVGDFLELWQPPDDILCAGEGASAGCSVPELVDLTRRIVRAHAGDLDALRKFAARGDNRLYVIPGNHDAALLIPQVWAPVFDALGGSDRVTLQTSGLWRSADKRVLAEHGHQIGIDVNRFDDWPAVTTKGAKGEDLMIRPWGERFVQKLFNAEEAQYPIIDNLNPESAGARYRMAERGVSGTAADFARFLVFNVFETSIDQKVTSLDPGAPGTPPAFDRATAIAAAPALLAGSLPANDPFRQRLEKDDDEAKAIKRELTELAKSLSDDELKMLCQNVLLTEKRNLCGPSLGALVQSKLVPREAVFAKHVAERIAAHGDFDVFIYAHTHRWERGWEVRLPRRGPVTVFNTGAFQRLVDEEAFVQRADAKKLTPAQALRQMQPEDLAPCYGVVVVKPGPGGIETELRLWEAPENGGGRFRSPGIPQCK